LKLTNVQAIAVVAPNPIQYFSVSRLDVQLTGLARQCFITPISTAVMPLISVMNQSKLSLLM